MVEDALHFHATSGVGDAQGAAGDQAFHRGGPVGGPHQTPVRLVMGPLQDFHGLATADGQLGAVTGREVVDHHCQLTAAGQLGREGTGQRAQATGPQQARLVPGPGARLPFHSWVRAPGTSRMRALPFPCPLIYVPFETLEHLLFHVLMYNNDFLCVTLSESDGFP